jgi:replicative DNA helicase
LWGSAEERLELLAGWVDVLGSYWASEQRLVLDLNNAPLAKQLKFVADSLGFWTRLEQEENNFRLIMGGKLALIPSRRHDLNLPSFRTTTQRCSSIRVEKDQVDDYYGFTLDANNLFLLEDMTVTHNTSFTMAVARNAAIDFNKGVAFFSLEMSSLQLVNRLISMETEIASEKLRKGQLEEYEWQQLHNQVDKLSNVPLYIDDTPGISIFELRAKCRRLKMQHDIQMIIIDYLQLMTGGGDNKGNREQEISMISRGLKGLAKELNVPVIALSQLSRAVETRGGSKRPQLSDLRESGAIEQDADIVSFIYRPEYYQILEDEEGNSLKGIGEIIVAKHRNGALDSVRLKWDGQYAKFSNLDDDAFTGLDDATFFDQASDQLSGETFLSKMNEAKDKENKNSGIDDVPF